MTEAEGRLKLALTTVRKAAQLPEAAELTVFGLGGAAILCMWSASILLDELSALTEGRPSFDLPLRKSKVGYHKDDFS